MARTSRRCVALLLIALVGCSAATDDVTNDAQTAEDPVVAPACTTNDDCSRIYYCAAPQGQCGPGTCKPRGIGVFCVSTYNPVCGCNGETYRNACWAMKAGASLAYDGECATLPTLPAPAIPLLVSRDILRAFAWPASE